MLLFCTVRTPFRLSGHDRPTKYGQNNPAPPIITSLSTRGANGVHLTNKMQLNRVPNFSIWSKQLEEMLARAGVQQLRQRLSCIVHYVDCSDGNCSRRVEIRACSVQWQASGFTRYGELPVSLA
jgi:hypothetical protein